MGDSRIAYYILEHGIPSLLDPPLPRRPDPTLFERQHLQNILEELMVWFSLLTWLADHRSDPNTIMAQKLSDLDQKQWQTERRRRKDEVRKQLREGAHLAEPRDSDRKPFHDRSATEQRVLEVFDCGKLRKLHDEVRVRKPEHCSGNSRQEPYKGPLGHGVMRLPGMPMMIQGSHSWEDARKDMKHRA